MSRCQDGFLGYSHHLSPSGMMKITQIMCGNPKIHGPTSMTSGRLQLWSQALEDKSLAQTFHGWVDDSSSLVDDSMIHWYSLIFVDFKATCVVSSDLHWETSNISHMQDNYDILTYKLFIIINFYSHPILHYCQIIIKYLVSEGSYLLGFILKTCRCIDLATHRCPASDPPRLF